MRADGSQRRITQQQQHHHRGQPLQQQQQLTQQQDAHDPRFDEVADVLLACKSACVVTEVLESAAAQDKHQLLAALLNRLQNSGSGASVETISPAFLAAVDKGHVQCIRLLLDSCTASSPHSITQLLGFQDKYGRTALITAAACGHAQCLALLLERCPPDQLPAALIAESDHGHTALMDAVVNGDASCVQLLLAHCPHVQVTAADSAGCSALMWTALGCDADCMRLLLAHSPAEQLLARSFSGQCALSFVAGSGLSGCVDCLQLLLVHSPPQQQLNQALLAAGRKLQDRSRLKLPAAQQQQQLKVFRRCVELLLAAGARLPDGAQGSAGAGAAVWGVMQELAAAALVPDRANEAVLGLALADAQQRRRKRRASSGEEEEAAAAAAGPAKCARTSA